MKRAVVLALLAVATTIGSGAMSSDAEARGFRGHRHHFHGGFVRFAPVYPAYSGYCRVYRTYHGLVRRCWY